MTDFGPNKYNCELIINPSSYVLKDVIAIDIETDEKDNFVGLAVCGSSKTVYYTTELNSIRRIVTDRKLVTHGGKFDLIMLRKWGIPVSSDQLLYDTKVMAHFLNPIKGRYGLKGLAEEYCGMKWPTYKEIVGTGKKKVTLDQQPIERVARYCGMDALATFKVYEYLNARLLKSQKEYLNEIEMPFYRALLEMEEKGIQVDAEYLKKLDAQFLIEMERLENRLNQYVKEPFNPRSPKQVIKALKEYGVRVNSTDSRLLNYFKDRYPMVQDLLKYREVSKLRSTYTHALLENPTLPRIHSFFSPTRTVTGRLASSKPNLQNIPIRTEKGKLLRKAFCAKEGHVLLAADYSQIEYRLFTHLTQDSTLLDVYETGKDIHVAAASKSYRIPYDDVDDSQRRIGKTLNFAAIYGAMSKKIAQILSIPQSEAEQLLDTYWKELPKAAAWITRIKWEAHKNEGVQTLLGYYIPLPEIRSKRQFDRFHAERQAVNYIIQGSAAEVIKKAMINLRKDGLIPVLQVHDELLFEVKDDPKVIAESYLTIKRIMENVMQLSVPLTVDIGSGKTWGDAK